MLTRFLNQKILGLDISDFSIEVICLKKSFFGYVITAYNRGKIRPGIFENGEIKDPEELANSIKSLLREAVGGPIKERLCIVSLPDSRIFTANFQLPAFLDKRELKQSLLLEVEKTIPLKLEESFYDYQLTKKNNKSINIFYAAADKSLIYKYIEALRKAGLIPVVFDMEMAALGRALINNIDLENEKKLLIADIGARTTNVGFFDQGQLFSSLTIPVGGNDFTKKISEALKINIKEAEIEKKKCGFDQEFFNGKIYRALEFEFKPIINEMGRYIHYLDDYYHQRVNTIILAGGSSLMPRIKEYFKNCFDYPIEIRNPINKFKKNKIKITKKDFLLFANVAGLAIRGFDRNFYNSGLNFLAKADYEKTKPKRRRNFFAAPKIETRSAVLVFCLLALILALIFLEKARGVW